MYDHLHPEVAQALQRTTDERIIFCQTDRWIGYSRALQIVQQLEDLFVYPKSLRMPNLLLVGKSDNGKSSILQHFVKRHPMTMRDDGSSDPCVLCFAMPAMPTETNFWSEVLWALNIQHRERDTPEKKRRQAFGAMEYACVGMLAIDEFNHLVNAGKDASRLLSAIKNVSTQLRLPMVVSGTQLAIHALGKDQQMTTRFEPAVLDRWTLNGEYLRFLTTYETFLPLAEKSNLASRELATEIYGMSGSNIGGTVKLLKGAATYALTKGRERIDLEVLRSMNYVRTGGWDALAARL